MHTTGTYINIYKRYIHVHANFCIYTHIPIHICTYIHIHTHAHMCKHLFSRICISHISCICGCTYPCVCLQVCNYNPHMECFEYPETACIELLGITDMRGMLETLKLNEEVTDNKRLAEELLGNRWNSVIVASGSQDGTESFVRRSEKVETVLVGVLDLAEECRVSFLKQFLKGVADT